jgi:hypothetical protein
MPTFRRGRWYFGAKLFGTGLLRPRFARLSETQTYLIQPLSFPLGVFRRYGKALALFLSAWTKKADQWSQNY